jgi:hypothetical protein
MLRSIVAILFLLAFNNEAFCQTRSLQISENKRYIEDKNGKPFLWIGDTAWELFHKLNRKEADRYLTKRAKQGFTVIQAVVLAEDDGLKKPNAYGEVPLIDLDPEKPNLKYFEHVDYIINKAEKLGLYIALLPTWADKVPSNRPGIGPVVFNDKNAGTYGEFLAKRYAKNNIIWVLGGDRNIDNTVALNIWQAMATGIKKEDHGRNLMTYHPAGENSSSTYKEEWIDFNMYQSGHAHYYMPVYKFARKDYDTNPRKPFLDSEPAYEDIPVKFWQYINWDSAEKVPGAILNKNNTIKQRSYFKAGYFTDYDVRVHAYWNFLSGACGYTYGNNAIWQMFEKYGNFTIPTLTSWKKALNRPGAKDMKHLKTFFKAWPFEKLKPDQSLILNPYKTDNTYISAAISSDNSFAIIYLAIGQPVKVDLSKLNGGRVLASWYNPREGKLSKPALIDQEDRFDFIPPSSGINNDWLLVLTASDF